MAAVEAVEAIFRAAGEGDIEGVARLLDEDPRLLSSTTWSGYTLLMEAAVPGHVGLVRWLLERGADVNIAGAKENTALHYAAHHRHEEVVSMLLTGGADPSRVNDAGETALMYAVLPGHLAVVRLLLRSMGGRGLDERDDRGWTALFYACVKGRADVARSLLLAGADHTIADNYGTTPQELAHHMGQHECLTVLQWWEAELQRPYVLHKARTLHEDFTTRQQAPAAPGPAYLGLRVQGSMPSVAVRALEQWEKEGGSKRGRAEEERQEKDEELGAMVGYVVKDLDGHLYTELMQGLGVR